MAGATGFGTPTAPSAETRSRPADRPATAARPRADLPARSIDLRPRDWRRATWRRTSGALPALDRPPAKPFDRAAALDRARKIGGEDYLSGINWSRARIPLSMTAEEARFWLRAMHLTLQEGREGMPARLEQAALDGPATADEA